MAYRVSIVRVVVGNDFGYAMKAHRGISLLVLDPGAGKGRVVSATHQPPYPHKGHQAQICTGGWIVLVTGLNESGRFRPIGFRAPDPPGRS